MIAGKKYDSCAVDFEKSKAGGMKGTGGSWAELRAGGGQLFRQPFKGRDKPLKILIF